MNEIYEIAGVSNDFLTWCNKFKQRPEVIRSRISLGQSLEDALRECTNNSELLCRIDDEIHTLQHWCQIYCINVATVHSRLKRGWTLADALMGDDS